MRKIVLKYTEDNSKKVRLFEEEMKKYEKELKEYNIEYIKKLNDKRSQQFEIQLIGYDGYIKYKTNKVNCLPEIFKLIDTMPMGKIEQKLRSTDLYTNAHPNKTIKGLGYKDEKKVKESLEKIKDESKKRQYLIIHTLYYRAKYHPHKTDDMKKAEKILGKSLQKLKKETKSGGSNRKLPYLKLDLINKYEKLADYYNVSRKARGLEKPTTSDEGFLIVYRRIKGDSKKLKDIPCKKSKPDGVNWERKREIEVSGKYGQMKKMKIPLYHTSGELEGLPTVMHINMIMWAYSPDPKGLIKKLSLLKKIKK